MTDFRVFTAAIVEPAEEGTTILTGANGSGKTTVLEAVAFLGSQRSFRGAPRDAMVRSGSERAYVRGELMMEGRRITVELELSQGTGRSRAQINRQRARRAELAEAVPSTVFSPEDLEMVRGGPAGRRRLLDDALIGLDRRASMAVEETERALRQRSALLRQAAGRLTADVERSLDVWDLRLGTAGDVLVSARQGLLGQLHPLVEEAYGALAGTGTVRIGLHYEASWFGPYLDALAARRREDVRRAVTTVGPHRDDVVIELDGRDARLQASQGEQRCLALGLRLGLHNLMASRLGRPPLLLLDDVFSELDPVRTRALVRQLPAGQCLLTTAMPVPSGVNVAKVVDVAGLSA